MKTVCEKNMCAACMACVNSCKKNAIKVVDDIRYYNAYINSDKCIDCGSCKKICPINNPPVKYDPINWYQGWADDEIRKKSSSGGFATDIALSFVKNGGKVCSCLYRNGEFIFSIAETIDEVLQFSGSKYVKSNPKDIYKQVLSELQTGKVLFIGLPCQVAALKNHVGVRGNQNLYTIDLICHGTPSLRLLSMALDDYNQKIDGLESISFRNGNDFALSCNGKPLVPHNVFDKYILAFLYGFSYTQNCYYCKFTTKKRTADMTLGDSWGSELPDDEKKKGISLALITTEKGKELISISNLHLYDVDIDKAIANNKQLKQPSEMTKRYYKFYDSILKGGSFSQSVYKAYFSKCVKQDIKNVMYRYHLWENE